MGITRQRLTGRIVLVQEDRFRLVGPTGKGYLFSLFHSARASMRDLNRWHEADTNVIVEYEGEPDLASGIARKVEPHGYR